jgi:PAS domain S-box-containing protein
LGEVLQEAEAERARHETEARSKAYLDAALDCVIMADKRGRVVEFNAAAERTFGYSRAEALGRPLAELIVPAALRERHTRAFAQFAETGEERIIGRRIELTGMRADGSEFPVELALSRVDSEPLLVCGALRDLSEAKRAEDDLRRLADTQAALRRVATLVAHQAPADELLATVAEEAARILDVPLTSILSYEPDGGSVLCGAFGDVNPFQVGDRYPPHPGVVAEVWRTGKPASVSYAEAGGTVAAQLTRAGIRSGLGVPIVVDEHTWGVAIAMATEQKPLPKDTQARLTGFTELIGTAIANVEARQALHRLVEEQAALRRVATIVAREPAPGAVFAAVAEECGKLLGIPLISMARYEPDGTVTVVAASKEEPFPVGSNLELDGPSVMASVLRTGRPARIDDYADVPGTIAQRVRDAGIPAALGVPIVVDGKTWGAMVAVAPTARRLPDGIENRLTRFTELVATAIANAQTRGELRQLADEQLALRNVATLVAQGAAPGEVFAAVAEQVARLLDVPAISMVRFEPDRTSTAIAVYGDENPFGAGAKFTPHPGVMLQVRETGRPARLEDYAHSTGPTTARLRAAGISSGVGVPIVVEGAVWGATIALAPGEKSLPAGIEPRLANFTELVATAIANTQAREDLRSLVDEQSALRRLALQVAGGAEPAAVFNAVCEETGRLFGATSTNLAHFTPDGFNLTMAGWSLRDTHVPTGTKLPLEGETINAVVQRTAAPARVDSYEETPGELAALIRERGIRSEVGAPVIVEGRVWGALIAGWDTEQPSAEGTEARLAAFAELIATAVANATARAELIASRARIIKSADQARRKIERDLHDGTQQQLVALGLDLQTLETKLPGSRSEAHEDLARVREDLAAVLDDVREISRGVHPAILSSRGLEAALRALRRRAPLPVELTIHLPHRLPQSIEIAAYYAVSEALANVAKHAQASFAAVTISAAERCLLATVRDDGIGGADAAQGSGLTGLADRVEALGGRFLLDSPRGRGTTVSIELPVP